MITQVPIHFSKLIKEYTAGRIKIEDVKVTPNLNDDVSKDAFEFSLPLFTWLGDPNGTHKFSITLESLVSTKLRLQEEMNAAIAAFDKFMEEYDDLIAILQDVRGKKSAAGPLTLEK